MDNQDSKPPFSERQGISSIKKAIQTDSIDETLRNRIWNALDKYFWHDAGQKVNLEATKVFSRRLQDEYFKQAYWSLIVDVWPMFCLNLRGAFSKFEWYEVYDFVEFVVNNYPNADVSARFTEECNNILEEERSGYRFVSGIVVPITSAEDRGAIEDALDKTANQFELTGANIHLREALRLLSNHEDPSYRNSIKESISAVESTCQIVAADKKATLGTALNAIMRDGRVELHGALKQAFSSLYGYTNDANGIRHALVDEPNLGLEDAQFMLVVCSAFVSYLFSKAVKAGML
ncbi:MAG: AbiJ-NTD4 domain-containing protein [Halobacteriota archaeon]